MSLFSELRRRKVIRTAIVYVAAAWIGVQVADTLVPVFGGDEAVVRLIVIILGVGFPIAVLVSWFFNWSPSGFEREAPAALATGGPGVADTTAQKAGTATSDSSNAASGSRPALVEDLTPVAPLPAPPNQLVGRNADVLELTELLESDCRLVTLTGPGGTGKTRLAIEAATAVRDQFPNGVVYVDLTPVTHLDAVIPTIAQTLGVKEAETRTMTEGLHALFADLQVLLVLDNLEQVVDAAPAIANLLSRAAGLRILSTSRVPLRVSSESEYPVLPLALPPAADQVSREADLDTWPATRLFIQRARQARHSFTVSDEDRTALVEICRRLDGLPLALELAAARVRALDLPTILDRLEKSLDFLRGGGRDLPPRQRALRATIDWSHSLLDDTERQVFRRLAVFWSGFPRDIAVQTVGEGKPETEEVLEALVEKGLIRPPDTLGRYGIFETLREYAMEQLEESGEVQEIRKRHAANYAAFADRLNELVGGHAQREGYRRGLAEEPNMHGALDFLLAQAREGDDGALELGLTMTGHLWFYWHIRNLQLTSRAYAYDLIEIAEGRPGSASKKACAWASQTAAIGDWMLGHYDQAEEIGHRFWPLPEGESEDRLDFALRMMEGVNHLGRQQPAEAIEVLNDVAQRARESNQSQHWAESAASGFCGMACLSLGRFDDARTFFERGFEVSQPGEHLGHGLALSGLAALATVDGDHARSSELWEAAVEQYGLVDDRGEQARVYEGFAWSVLAEGESERARELFYECMRAFEDVGSLRGVGVALMGMAAAEVHLGNPVRSATIAAAARRYSDEEGIMNFFGELPTVARHALAEAQADLDASTLEECGVVGSAMSVREAGRFAMQFGVPV